MQGPIISSVLFVCVGNICRSPMAEAVFAHRMAGSHPHLRISSAGVSALVGDPADPLAVALMTERGIDLSRHRARQLDPKLASAHEMILVMEDGHRRAVEDIFPAARGRVHRLGRFGGFDVPDPYMKPRAAFEESLRLIDLGIADFERSFWSVK